MSELTQEDFTTLATAVVAYEIARAEGKPATCEFNAAVKLLEEFPPDVRTQWRVRLTMIRQRFGN